MFIPIIQGIPFSIARTNIRLITRIILLRIELDHWAENSGVLSKPNTKADETSPSYYRKHPFSVRNPWSCLEVFNTIQYNDKLV